jgi:ribonuclease-3
VVADYLFKSAYKVEGKMTEEKKQYVSKAPLSKACKHLKIDKYLLVDENVEISIDLQENLMESLICAIYLDGGIEPAKKFIYDNIINKFDIIGNVKCKDYKSELNELSSKKRVDVDYVEVKRSGLDNNPKFTVRLLINGKKIAESTATGRKQNAEQLVAKKGIEYLLKK